MPHIHDDINPVTTIAVIGGGNVATHLLKAFTPIVQVHAVNPRTFEGMPATCDVALISVKDDAVAEVASRIEGKACVVAHTSGSIPASALADAAKRYGVFYPMQTFTRGREADFSVIPVFLEAPSPELRPELEAFARKLSGTVIWADSAQRCKVHLAAVFACNFANHMYAVGERIVRGAGLDFDVLKPLIAETAAKACDARSPLDVQTGPAVRNDFATKARHGDLLAFDLRLKNIYSTISQSIWETSKKI